MAREEGVRITGLRETVRNLEKLGANVEDLKDVFGPIAEDVASQASGLVKVDSGALQATIRPARTKNKAVVRAGTATGVPYAGVINYGRDGLGGDQFLTGPANKNPEGRAAEIEAGLQRLIRKYDLN